MERGPWTRKSYAAVIFDEKIGNHCMIGQKRKSGLFLQDFIWEKGILDIYFCPFWSTQPFSLFYIERTYHNLF
jgi:hypothetical protein